MPRGSLYMLAEFPSDGMPFGEFTKETPGATVDVLSEPPVQEGAERVHPSIVLVKGAPPEALQRLLARAEAAYGPVVTLRRDPRVGTWLGRVRLRESAMARNPGIRALAQVAGLYGVPWAHHEAGVLHLRARIREPDDRERLLRDLQGSLRQAGVDAQVDVQEAGPDDHSVWAELVQYGASAGRPPR